MDRVFEVAATPGQVWTALSDLRRTFLHAEPTGTAAMQGTDRPIAKGTIFQLKTGSGLKSTWTVTSWVPPTELMYHVDLGVFDGGTTAIKVEATPAGSRILFRVPLLPWPQTWAPVRWATQPLVRRTARRDGEAFERAVRALLG